MHDAWTYGFAIFAWSAMIFNYKSMQNMTCQSMVRRHTQVWPKVTKHPIEIDRPKNTGSVSNRREGLSSFLSCVDFSSVMFVM